jgi:L-fucose mutarotase
MPLKGIPVSITPELLYALAKMGHGDSIVIADANFPSDSVASHCIIKTPVRVSGSTSSILKDILNLLPLDAYHPSGIFVMDRVQPDKDRGLVVPAYEAIATVTEVDVSSGLSYVERFDFYEKAKTAFCVVQTDDRTLYANVIVCKGVV